MYTFLQLILYFTLCKQEEIVQKNFSRFNSEQRNMLHNTVNWDV